MPVGPRKVAPKNQVSIPDELLAAIGAAQGDSVWIMLNPDKAETLVIMPRAVMRAVMEKGWTATS